MATDAITFRSWRQEMDRLIQQTEANLRLASTSVSTAPPARRSSSSSRAVGSDAVHVRDPISVIDDATPAVPMAASPPALSLGVAGVHDHLVVELKTLQEDIAKRIRDGIESSMVQLEAQQRTLKDTLGNEIRERLDQVERRGAERLAETLATSRKKDADFQKETRLELQTSRRTMELSKIKNDEIQRTLANVSEMSHEALRLARRHELDQSAEKARTANAEQSALGGVSRLESALESLSERLDSLSARVDNVHQVRTNIEKAVADLDRAAHDARQEAICAQTQAERRFVEIGADILEMHELVQSQCAETR